MNLTKMSLFVINNKLYLLGKGVSKVSVFVLAGAIISFSRLRRRWKDGQRTEKVFIFQITGRQNVHSFRLDSVRLTDYG